MRTKQKKQIRRIKYESVVKLEYSDIVARAYILAGREYTYFSVAINEEEISAFIKYLYNKRDKIQTPILRNYIERLYAGMLTPGRKNFLYSREFAITMATMAMYFPDVKDKIPLKVKSKPKN